MDSIITIPDPGIAHNTRRINLTGHIVDWHLDDASNGMVHCRAYPCNDYMLDTLLWTNYGLPVSMPGYMFIMHRLSANQRLGILGRDDILAIDECNESTATTEGEQV